MPKSTVSSIKKTAKLATSLPVIGEKNWWCNYCVHNDNGNCEKLVPYYASSLDCMFFDDQSTPPVKHKRFDLKKILVETI